MDIEKFEKDMAVFSFRQHQDTLTYLAHLKANGWTIANIRRWIEERKEKLTQQQEYKTVAKKCPLCQSSMSLLSLNFSPATLTGEDSKSVWLCSNKDCMNTIYNKESVNEITRKGGT